MGEGAFLGAGRCRQRRAGRSRLLPRRVGELGAYGGAAAGAQQPRPPPHLPPPSPLHSVSYVNTAACKSAISYIDGDKGASRPGPRPNPTPKPRPRPRTPNPKPPGILRYRGYPIEQLAERCTFPEVAHLVIYGRLPTGGELSSWEEALARHSALPPPVVEAVAALPHDAHFMGTVLTGARGRGGGARVGRRAARASSPPPLSTALCALSTCHPEQNPALAGNSVYADPAVQDKQIARLVGKMPAIAALAYHRASGRAAARPNQRLGYAENFLFMLDAGASPDYRPNPVLARVGKEEGEREGRARGVARPDPPTPPHRRLWTSCSRCTRSTR